ncbi:2687_t:CDS:2, partial [Racocetra persica]
NESVDIASSNNKVQMLEENLNKELEELEDEIDMNKMQEDLSVHVLID